MDFEFGFIKFVAFPDDEYRVKASESEGKKVSIWMENKKLKSQWEIELSEDVSKYGPAGMPLPALVYYLQNAFSRLDKSGTKPTNAASASCVSAKYITLSAAMDDCSKVMILTLKVKFSPVWESTYYFKLNNKKISKMEVLEARLRDCEENLQLFKALLWNPRIIKFDNNGDISDSEPPATPLPFTVQKKSSYSNITFTQSGLCRRNLCSNPNNNTPLYALDRVAIGASISVCNNTIVEFTADI